MKKVLGIAPFAVLVYAIHQLTSLEHRTDNPGNKGKLLLAIHVVLIFLLNLFMNAMGDVYQMSESEYRSFVGLIIVITFVYVIVELIGYFGAAAFTEWFDQLAYSYKAPTTSRFKWLFILRVVIAVFLFLSILQLQAAIYNNSMSQLVNSVVLIGLAALVTFVVFVVEILAVYKLYSNCKISKRASILAIITHI